MLRVAIICLWFRNIRELRRVERDYVTCPVTAGPTELVGGDSSNSRVLSAFQVGGEGALEEFEAGWSESAPGGETEHEIPSPLVSGSRRDRTEVVQACS